LAVPGWLAAAAIAPVRAFFGVRLIISAFSALATRAAASVQSRRAAGDAGLSANYVAAALAHRTSPFAE
jgi:hypothetical protein